MLRADYSGLFNDECLSKRGVSLLDNLFRKNYRSIQSIASNRAEQKGYYRFLNSPKAGETAIIEEMAQRCSKLVSGKTVLCIQDTTEINLVNHTGRLKPGSGFVPIDAVKKGIGFKVHPAWSLMPKQVSLMVYAGISLWHRTRLEKLNTTHRERLPIDQKESVKWVHGNENAAHYLNEASEVIVVQDREADIYEQFVKDWGENVYLLIRSRFNRALTDGNRLWDKLEIEPVARRTPKYLPTPGFTNKLIS